MFFDIFFNYEGFSVTEKSGKLGKVWKRQYFAWNRSQFSKTLMLSFLENSVNKNKRNQQKIKGRFLKCSPTMWVFILKHDVCTSLTSRIIIIFFIPLVSDLPEIEECLHWTATIVWNSFQIWNLFFSLDHKMQSVVIKSLKVWSN